MTAQEWVLVIGAIAAGTATILGALGALWVKVHTVDQRVNGRMTELLDLTRTSSEAVGQLRAAAALPRVHSSGPGAPPTAP